MCRLHSRRTLAGYLCERRHLEKKTGCCQATSSSIRGPYTCDTCSSITDCCTSFEHCISCCLKPDHVRTNERARLFASRRLTSVFQRLHLENYIRSRHLQTKLLLSQLSTLFDVCLSRCRTHGASVVHENEYVDVRRKHCYGTAGTVI